MKKSLLYLFVCLFSMSLTVACGDDDNNDIEFKGSPTNPITSVDLKKGNVVHKSDDGETVEIYYYNFVKGKLDNIKAEIHYKTEELADVSYNYWKNETSAEEKEFTSVKKNGKTIKAEFGKGSDYLKRFQGATAAQLVEYLNYDE